jgi:hypothetical protein
MPGRPIALTDDQLSRVMQACEVLEPHARSAFLVALAQLLRSQPVIGDGALHRCIRDLMPQFHEPLGVNRNPMPRSRRRVGDALA